MLSPMCPRSLGYTRYLPVGPPALPAVGIHGSDSVDPSQPTPTPSKHQSFTFHPLWLYCAPVPLSEQPCIRS